MCPSQGDALATLEADFQGQIDPWEMGMRGRNGVDLGRAEVRSRTCLCLAYLRYLIPPFPTRYFY